MCFPLPATRHRWSSEPGEDKQYQKVLKRLEARRFPLRKEIAKYERIERDAKRYQSLCEELTKLAVKRANLKKRIETSRKTRKKADQQHKTNRQLLTACFNNALSRTNSVTDEGRIEINARGIFPVLEHGLASEGEALGTSTVLAFDLACMLASMTGLGNHPRFLIDDSPRDADMEPPIYASLLQSIADLENLSDPIPFQYILTTTTRPPEKLACDPYGEQQTAIQKVDRRSVDCRQDREIRHGNALAARREQCQFVTPLFCRTTSQGHRRMI